PEHDFDIPVARSVRGRRHWFWLVPRPPGRTPRPHRSASPRIEPGWPFRGDSRTVLRSLTLPARHFPTPVRKFPPHQRSLMESKYPPAAGIVRFFFQRPGAAGALWDRGESAGVGSSLRQEVGRGPPYFLANKETHPVSRVGASSIDLPLGALPRLTPIGGH